MSSFKISRQGENLHQNSNLFTQFDKLLLTQRDELVYPDDVKFYGAVGDGVANDTVAIQTAFNSSRKVCFPPGTYLVSNLIAIPANTYICGTHASIIKRIDSAAGNFYTFQFQGDNSTIDSLQFDGNKANNTTTIAGAAFNAHVSFFGTRGCQVFNCYMHDSTGLSFHMIGDFRNVRIQNNYCTREYAGGIFAFGADHDSHSVVCDNVFIGNGGIIGGASLANYVVYDNNMLIAPTAGIFETLTVNTSGTTVSKNTGTEDWTTLVPYLFIVLDNGKEFHIVSIDSPTQLTVSSALPTLVNTRAVIGCGDGIAFQSTSNCIARNNTVIGPASYGMGTSTGDTVDNHNISFQNNYITSGKSGIYVGAGFSGASTAQTLGTQVIGNNIVGAGTGGTANAINERNGIQVQAFAGNRVVDTTIIGNTIDCVGNTAGQAENALYLDPNLDIDSVIQFGNAQLNAAAGAVVPADIKSVVLSAEWGDAAVNTFIPLINGQGIIQIVSAGAGQAVDATITIERVTSDGPSPTPQLVLGNSTIADAASYGLPFLNISATPTLVFQWKGTPTSGDSLTLYIKM